ncbi:MAG: hypothetical protein ACP6IS_04760 [Candidatus Asgardarchaeia archaeon]
MSEVNIPKAIKIKVKSLADLTRLAITWALRHNPQALFYLKDSEKHFLFTITTTLGYFELRGLPLIVYVELDKPPEGKFIAYTTDPEETVLFKNTTEDRKYQYVPIVELAERPAFF